MGHVLGERQDKRKSMLTDLDQSTEPESRQPRYGGNVIAAMLDDPHSLEGAGDVEVVQFGPGRGKPLRIVSQLSHLVSRSWRGYLPLS